MYNFYILIDILEPFKEISKKDFEEIYERLRNKKDKKIEMVKINKKKD
jgi:hypothetical protein